MCLFILPTMMPDKSFHVKQRQIVEWNSTFLGALHSWNSVLYVCHCEEHWFLNWEIAIFSSLPSGWLYSHVFPLSLNGVVKNTLFILLAFAFWVYLLNWIATALICLVASRASGVDKCCCFHCGQSNDEERIQWDPDPNWQTNDGCQMVLGEFLTHGVKINFSLRVW